MYAIVLLDTQTTESHPKAQTTDSEVRRMPHHTPQGSPEPIQYRNRAYAVRFVHCIARQKCEPTASHKESRRVPACLEDVSNSNQSDSSSRTIEYTSPRCSTRVRPSLTSSLRGCVWDRRERRGASVGAATRLIGLTYAVVGIIAASQTGGSTRVTIASLLPSNSTQYSCSVSSQL